MPVYIEKKWLDKRTNKQGNIELLSHSGPWPAEMSKNITKLDGSELMFLILLNEIVELRTVGNQFQSYYDDHRRWWRVVGSWGLLRSCYETCQRQVTMH